jgi:CSLREA domain-containing protein
MATERRTPGPERISAHELEHLRAGQRQLIAHHRPAPTFAGVAARATTQTRRFTVNTTEDSGLANPASGRCIDAASGACSLRAAVDAANNRTSPTRILLGRHRYVLSSGEQLTVTNPVGTSIVGAGARRTTIQGQGSGVFEETHGVRVSSAPLLFVNDLTVTGGSAVDGGGFFLAADHVGATLVLKGVRVSGNTASDGGGGLYSFNYASIYAKNSSFAGNVAPTGGGLFTANGQVNLTDVSITGNHSPTGASGQGGGLYNFNGVVRISGGSISGNSTGDPSTQGLGGGIYDEASDLGLTGVHLDHNTAFGARGGAQGGGLYLNGDLAHIAHGTISHNHARGHRSSGGGVYAASDTQAELTDLMMAGNRVSTNPAGSGVGAGGGAVFVDSDLMSTQVTIGSGTTIKGSNAGAVYAHASSGEVDLSINRTKLTHNTNSFRNGLNGLGCGGAVCVDSDQSSTASLSLHHSEIVGNTSVGDQGAGGISAFTGSAATARVHSDRTLFQDNASGASGLGGAVGVWSSGDTSPATLDTEYSTFVGNRAGSAGGPGRGGAIGTEGNTVLSDSHSTFRRNRAIGDGAYGGGVYSNGERSSLFTGSVFTGNSSGPAVGGDGHGGAVFVDDQAGSAFTGVTVTGNRTASFGGGIDASINGYDVSVERSTIANNAAGNTGTYGDGGGIYAFNAVLTVENSTLVHNRAYGAAGHGGGIYSEGGVLGLRYSTVVDNVGRHGGVYTYNAGGEVLGSIVTGNRLSPGGAEHDCTAWITPARLHSDGGNVLGQRSCVTATQASDRISRHPRLGRLKDNGGPTMTRALSAKSPAIGRGIFQCPATDQRGRHRPSTHCDAGAFELPRVKKHHHHHAHIQQPTSERTQP